MGIVDVLGARMRHLRCWAGRLDGWYDRYDRYFVVRIGTSKSLSRSSHRSYLRYLDSKRFTLVRSLSLLDLKASHKLRLLRKYLRINAVP